MGDFQFARIISRRPESGCGLASVLTGQAGACLLENGGGFQKIAAVAAGYKKPAPFDRTVVWPEVDRFARCKEK
ncbi:hypothetical protein [Bradyrhizobium sp. B117]|uniref:hypothetical protein n=1 Tax=Bradyrhizobium sp. B117 TaxID=3140246 RepID=UPI003182F0CA